MMVYKLSINDEYWSLGLTYETSEGPYLLKINSIALSDWRPILVEPSNAGELGMGDFMSIGGVLGCNQRALSLLNEQFPNDVDFLPVTCESGNYYIVKVLKTVDCLDAHLSTFEHFPSGNIRRITRYMFNPVALYDNYIFHIPQRPIAPVFVSDTFKNFIEHHQLAGLEFTKLWER